MNQQAERRVGTIIGGKWRVDALLGSGSMAAVYAVTHRNGARAALKILHPTLCTDPAVCERFLGEGYLANSVKHTGIVRVLDDGVTDDGCVFLVMDLLEGETLEALRQKRGGKIPLPETLELADKLMDVLSAVHGAGIIHRDLKPQNVFVCEDGTLKLLDFGVARVFDRTSQSKLSMFGLVLGTPSFMSPEQALGSRDKVDHRSDIWSLGATTFTSLTGETVHLGANVQAKLLAAATVKARSIQMVMPDLAPAIGAAIDMALRFKKEDRWQTVDAMRRSFREARMQLGLGKPEIVLLSASHLALDEPTNVDKSAPRFDSKKLGKGGDQPVDGSTTLPNAAPAHGPDGTFIGMGSGGGKLEGVIGNDGSLPPSVPAVSQTGPQRAQSERPPRPLMKSVPPPLPARARARMASSAAIGSDPPPPSVNPPGTPPHAFAMPGPSPLPSAAAVVRRIPGVDDPAFRASRPDGQDGSIPAYGGTVKLGADDTGADVDLAALGVRRKGTMAVWLVAVFLAIGAVGGIGFFAVKRGPLSPTSTPGSSGEPPPPATTLPPPGTVPPPPTVPPPTTLTTAPIPGPTTQLVVPPPGLDNRTTDAAVTPPVRPVVAPGPRSGGHGPRTVRPQPQPSADPPATAEPPKPPATSLAPDPFGTPD